MVLSCRKVSAHASFALIGFYAVVEQVEPDFINLGNTVDSDRGTMRHAQGYHGTCTLVSGSQNTVISIHNNRFDDSESPDTLLQFQEFIFGQFPGVVISRSQGRNRIAFNELNSHTVCLPCSTIL